MNYLLDSHTFIWMDIAPEKVSLRVRHIIQDGGNNIFLSYGSVWEMQIKIALDKLNLNSGLAQTIVRQQEENNVQLLPIELDHIFILERLPLLHRDPFDRLLVAQAMVERIPILSSDSMIAQYEINVIW